MTCSDCGRELGVGDWPFCPHGDVGNFEAFRDEIPGGITLDNYASTPQTFYSHSERRAFMKMHGLQEKEKYCPMPGTDKDPQGIPNPEGYVDDQTMRNRQELFLRAHNSGHAKDFDAIEAGVITNQFSGTLTQRDAEAVASGDARRQARLGRRLHG